MIDLPCVSPPSRGGRSSEVAPVTVGADARAEVKTYLRLEGDDEDEMLGRLIAAAIGHGEMLTGRLFLTRTVAETLPVRGWWTRLGSTPVRAIATLQGLDAAGVATDIPLASSAIDIDPGSDGWVRVTQAGAATRVRVTYQAGIAAEWSGLPEPLRQGAVRLAAHLFTHRDAADEGAPPAAVAALWRPWRRMRLV